MAEWTVICVPAGADDGDTSGLAVMLTDGDISHEVSRVAFARQDSRHPDVEFADQLGVEIGKADEAAKVMNDLEDQDARERDIARAERLERARREVLAVLGPPSRSRKSA